MRVLKDGLWVSPFYAVAPKTHLDRVANGCGPKGFWSIVPETFYGLCVTPACNIHDWDYYEGVALKDKHRADRWALVNWNRIIKKNTKWWLLKVLRQRRAKIYYAFIKNMGEEYFLNK